MANTQLAVCLFVFLAHGCSSSASDNGTTWATPTIEQIQNYNVKTLNAALPLGWRNFCDADVDEGVMSFFPGSNPSDGVIYLLTSNNETITLAIRHLSKISEFGLDPELSTIIYVNAFLTDHIYNIRENLKYLQEVRRDYNIVIVDFAQDILQMYNTIKQNTFVEGYFVSKLISVLAVNGVKPSKITLVGHSVGANIAALGASLFHQETNDEKVSTLIAIDPAVMCQKDDMHVNPDVSQQVIVIHGESEVFSVADPLGTVDIYPNGNGLRYQPGCNTKICNHVFPFLLFLDSVIERTAITAVKCESWANFRRGKCDYSSLISLDLDFSNATSGKYYCITHASQPYGMNEDGLRYKMRSSKRTKSDSNVVMKL